MPASTRQQADEEERAATAVALGEAQVPVLITVLITNIQS